MAKWGEGDPRWIVEERADAKNVNNWHWSEKNATNWSIGILKYLLSNLTFSNDERKFNSDKESEFNGKMEILNFGDEYSVDELDTCVSCTSDKPGLEDFRQFMLITEYSRDLILPTKENAGKPSTTTVDQNLHNRKLHYSVEDVKKVKDTSGQDILITEEFFCTPSDLYRVFTTKELIQAFTRNDAIVEATDGGNYSIFDGNILGVFKTLVPDKFIQMMWRKRDWPADCNSSLALEFNAFDGGTRLILTQKGIPAYDLDNTRNGWRTIFFSSLKQTYRYGTPII